MFLMMVSVSRHFLFLSERRLTFSSLLLSLFLSSFPLVSCTSGSSLALSCSSLALLLMIIVFFRREKQYHSLCLRDSFGTIVFLCYSYGFSFDILLTFSLFFFPSFHCRLFDPTTTHVLTLLILVFLLFCPFP